MSPFAEAGQTLLTREFLRERLSRDCPGYNRQPLPKVQGTPAAVLIALLAQPEGPHVILTRRTDHLADHPAEISLPGGRIEPQDAGPAEAARREAFEEIGLPPEKVELLGCLPTYLTVSDYCVYPFVGWVEPPVKFTPDVHEVADVFLVPLTFILDPANHQCGTVIQGGVNRHYDVISYPGYRIWGATAGMLVMLAHALDP